jgi:hypothetical protein
MTHSLRSRAIAAAAFVAACFTLAATAVADTISIDRDTSSYSGSFGGGEDKVLTFSGGVPSMGSGVAVTGGVFQTFCLEADVGISINTTYNYTVGTGATNGGVSGQTSTNFDPLDARTAYLYSKFWSGTLSNYDYTLGSARTTSATALQLAIWNLEGELVGTLQTAYDSNTQAQNWVSEANTAVASGGSWFGQGLGNVRVLNLTDGLGNDVQSLLVLVPLPPALLSGLGLLVGLGGIGVLRRRNRQALV